MDRPTFSESWSRVSRLTPTLRPQVQVRRRSLCRQRWYVLHEPVSQQFFRLNPVAYHLVGLLDGHRIVDDAWRLTLERYGDDAPTQPEVVGLLGQLNQANLLRVDLPVDAEPLLRRSGEQRARRWAGQAMSILFLQVPLLDPDPFLSRLLPLMRPLLSVVGLILWAVWVTVCAVLFLPHLGTFIHDSGSILAPANWGWVMVFFILIKLVHETGHGLVCKRLGGNVHEAGIMLLVLFPCPYVDTTSAWAFESRFQRVLVGAAGMMFELTIAGGAALVWLHADPGTTVRQVAHNIVLVASVATVIFNANPLMRFDGYFILSDLLEVPNLYDRSMQHLKWLGQRYAFGMTAAPPVATDRGERRILLVYGVLAAIYRVVVMAGIAMLIAVRFFTIGLALAIWTVGAWLLFPLGKFVHWLATSPALHRQRNRAVLVSVATALALLLAIGLVPAPQYQRTVGVVEARQRADVAIQSDGFVQEVKAEVGDEVRQGQVLLVCDNPILRAQRRQLVAQIKGLQLEETYALRNPADLAVAQAKHRALQQALDDANERIADLVVRSPLAGRLAGPPLAPLLGRYVKRGHVVAQVEDLRSLRVTALVDQAQNALGFFNSIRAVELRAPGDVGVDLPSRVLQTFDSGRTQLPHPALGALDGGPVATDPHDPKGMTALRPQFEIWLAVPPPRTAADPPFLPGERVYVRFTLAQRRPLLWQWIHRFRQIFREPWET